MNEEKTFCLYWLDGTTNILTGVSIEKAFTSGGYGGGAIHALDFYSVGAEPTHKWDGKDWNPIEAVFKPEVEPPFPLRDYQKETYAEALKLATPKIHPYL